jgi:hypothetical protein
MVPWCHAFVDAGTTTVQRKLHTWCTGGVLPFHSLASLLVNDVHCYMLGVVPAVPFALFLEGAVTNCFGFFGASITYLH